MIKSKLILLLVLTAIGIISSIAIIGGNTQRDALTQAASSQLLYRRNKNADEVTLYIESRRNQVAILAENQTIVAATMALQSAYDGLDSKANDPALEEALTNYYTTSYLPALSERVGNEVSLSRMLPTSAKTQFLQLHVVVKESILETAEQEDNAATDGSTAIGPDESSYSPAHAEYNPALQALTEQLGVADLLLISYEEEEVIYTTAKNPDLGTSLIDGPYRGTHLALVVRDTKFAGKGNVSIVDFQTYSPTLGRPVAFMGTIVADQADIPIALLVVQLTPDAIDRMVTNDQAWQLNGQGETGETYIVGSDHLMRTTSRFLVETQDDYIAALRANGQSEENISQIERHKSSILTPQDYIKYLNGDLIIELLVAVSLRGMQPHGAP